MKTLLSICMEYILCHPNLFCNDFASLPPHIKNRILKRITTVRYPSNIKFIYRSLVHARLKEIDFSLYEVDDELLRMISICTGLCKLILTLNLETSITESALLEVMPNFKNLCIFHAPKCQALTDNVMKSMIENSPNLMELNISECSELTDDTLGELAKLKGLSALNISRTNITIAGIKLYVQGNAGSTLKELRMAECPFVTAETINIICEECEALEVFIFYNSLSKIDLDQTGINFEKVNFKKMKQLTWSVSW